MKTSTHCIGGKGRYTSNIIYVLNSTHVFTFMAPFWAVLLVIGTLLPSSVLRAQHSADQPIVCFAPGTSAEVIEAVYQNLPFEYAQSTDSDGISLFRFDDGDRWSTTATNSSGLGQGDPTVLTWGIVPDGTFIPGSVGEPSAPSELIARLDAIYGDSPDPNLVERSWFPLFEQVFARWSELSGVTYVYEPADDGFSLSSIYPGILGTRPDIRIGGHPIDGNSGTLGYNFSPNNGDMVFDTNDNFFENLSSNSLGLRNFVAHEHGHGLGFLHTCPGNETKLMEPFISRLFDGPQHDEIRAVSRGYGDRYEHNETAGTAAGLGTPGFTSVTIGDLSIDDNADTDWFSFFAVDNTILTLSLDPVGFVYQEGPQGTPTITVPDGCFGDDTAVDSSDIHDLDLAVYAPNGTTLLAWANSQPAGQSETISDLLLNLGAGNYLIRVTGDSTNAAQLYELNMTLANGDPNLAPGNDLCQNAFCLEDGVSVDGTTNNATGITIAGCSQNDPNDVWFTYTPQVEGPVTVSLCGSSIDTTLAVLESCSNRVLIACNDDSCLTQSQLTFTGIPGVTYLIRVAGKNGQSGDYTIIVNGGQGTCDASCVPAPSVVTGPNPVDLAQLVSVFTDLGWSIPASASAATESADTTPALVLEPFVDELIANSAIPTLGFTDQGQANLQECLTINGPINFTPGSNRFRGNVLVYDEDQILSEIQADLSFTGSADITFVVYESSSSSGPFNKIYEQTLTLNGTGRALYSSGVISVNLRAGYYNAIGFGWQNTTGYFGVFDTYPQAFDKGTIEAGFGADGVTPPYFNSVFFTLNTGTVFNGVFCVEQVCPTDYDVYFGTSNPPTTKLCDATTTGTCDPTTGSPPWLDSCTTYYWRVVTNNCCGAIAGPVWSFTTGSQTDITGDGLVDFRDFAQFTATGTFGLSCTGPSWCNGADFNRDGWFNFTDLGLLTSHWLDNCLGL